MTHWWAYWRISSIALEIHSSVSVIYIYIYIIVTWSACELPQRMIHWWLYLTALEMLSSVCSVADCCWYSLEVAPEMSSDRPQGTSQPVSTIDTPGVMGGVCWVSIRSYQFLNQLNRYPAVYWSTGTITLTHTRGCIETTLSIHIPRVNCVLICQTPSFIA